MVNLVPTPESVMRILSSTGAYQKGHFVYPNGKHASHYFQMPLAFRYYDNARVLSVGLSRLFRVEKAVSSVLPKISVISPSPGGIMVAIGVREALGADQIYWAEMEGGVRQFRQFIGPDSYAFVFADQAYLRRDLANAAANEPTGLGTGLSFRTPAGLFQFVYSVGRANGQGFDVKTSKIHFGLTSRF